MTRPVSAIVSPGLEPAVLDTERPEFRWVAPRDLLVDEDYQRHLTRPSITLIRKIVAGWDWARFKPPVVAETKAGLEVIDGQHTAIAAATHGGIAEIPVMVVFAPTLTERADAFVGHNRDRIALTQLQMHHAALAAGDEDALTLQQVCDRAGVRLLRDRPADYGIGDCMAVVAIRALINRRHAMGARAILQALVEGHSAPVSLSLIRASEELLHAAEYKGQVEVSEITTTLLRLGASAIDKEAVLFASAHGVQHWRATAVVLFREARRGRRRQA